jgi:hypothetical protein
MPNARPPARPARVAHQERQPAEAEEGNRGHDQCQRRALEEGRQGEMGASRDHRLLQRVLQERDPDGDRRARG